jgi:hypothetical protein
MPAVTLNGTSFAGTVWDADSVVRAPQEINPDPVWPGQEWTAADGTPIVVRSGSVRNSWTLSWKRVPAATVTAVQAVFALSTTFSATLLGSTITAQCGLHDYTQTLDIAIPGPTYYYNVSLKITLA